MSTGYNHSDYVGWIAVINNFYDIVEHVYKVFKHIVTRKSLNFKLMKYLIHKCTIHLK